MPKRQHDDDEDGIFAPHIFVVYNSCFCCQQFATLSSIEKLRRGIREGKPDTRPLKVGRQKADRYFRRV